MKLALNYTIFALLATAANIGAQDVAIRWYHGDYAVTVAIMLGTFVGLIVKYVLDKKYIFHYRADSVSHDTRTFLVYTLMGVVTTAIFWCFEFGFYFLFELKSLRYLGGIIGLAIGYWMKYHLDKRFVFNAARLHARLPSDPATTD